MLLATLKILGLMLLTGPSLFILIWSVTGHEKHLLIEPKRKITGLLVTGAGIYLLPLLIEGVINIEDVSSGIELVNLLLCPLFILLFIKPGILQGKISTLLGLTLGLLIITLHASVSHSGYQAGIYPYLGLIVHLIVVSVWSGGLILLLFFKLAESASDDRRTHQQQKRLEFYFFQTSLFMLILLIMSGAVLMVNNVHNISILGITKYGEYLGTKLYLVGTIIFITLIEIFRVKRLFVLSIFDNVESGQVRIRKPFLMNVVKIVLVVLVIIYSGILTRLEAPNVAPFINPQSWQMTIADQNIQIDMQPVAGSTTNIRFEVFLPEQLMEMVPVIINFDLYIPDRDLGTFGEEAIQVSQNSFQGEATFPAPGNWQLDLNINMQDGTLYSGTHTFRLPSQPLIEDIQTYLSFSSITYSKSNIVSFLVGIGLILIYAWLTLRSFAKDVSPLLAITGLLGLSMGIYMVMSVVLVKTYPSTYWNNPQSYSSNTINQGKVQFATHCGECHGDSGGGDGSWAIENRGRIPDLGSPHMDVHTDGEIYWWITRGIPSLDMPPLGNDITEDDRWNIINFVRSLRHGIP